MLKKFILRILLGSMILSPVFVFAMGTNVMSSTTLKTKMEALRMEMRVMMASTTMPRMEKVGEHKFLKMTARYDLVITRLENILARLVSRIDKVKANGGDTTEAETLALTAKGHLDEAKTAFATLQTDVNTEISQETASSTKVKLRATLVLMRTDGKNVEMHLREAKETMMKIVGILMGQSGLHATTTTSASANL